MNRPCKPIQVHPSQWVAHSPLFTSDHVRGFISESGVVFKFVQRVSNDQELLSFSELIKSSRKYRSVIHSWFIKIELLHKSNHDLSTQEVTELEQLLKTLHHMETAWHLCEILFIDVRNLGSFLAQLLNWVKWHYTDYVELAKQVIVSDLPQMHEYYWDVVMSFVLYGEMENASLFLMLHSESKNNPAFMQVCELMKQCPSLSGNQVIHEYYLRWELWHENVLQAVNDSKIDQSCSKRSEVQLNLLLRLMAGDLDAFQQVNHLFRSWYQMMVSYLLFTDPCMKQNQLEQLCDQFISIFYATNENETPIEVNPFDELIRSCFNYNLMDVINRSSQCFDDNWWFVTHFIDLIHNSSQFKNYQVADIDKIRNAFVIDYAESLLAKPKQFWQLAVEYLINCKGSLDHIRLCLERVPFKDERQLQILLSTIKRFNFVDLERSLYKIQARQWLSKAMAGEKQKLGSSLFWAVRSKDKMLVNYIVDQYLRHYLRTSTEMVIKTDRLTSHGDLLDTDMISNLGSSIILSDRLIFLSKYHEFHQLRDRAQYFQAAKILVDMLDSNAIPEFFTLQVILDCLPLLESSVVVIDAEQTCKILASLEQIIDKYTRQTEQVSPYWLTSAVATATTNKQQDEEMKQIRLQQRNILNKHRNTLRAAISRNLSRNFVLPPAIQSALTL